MQVVMTLLSAATVLLWPLDAATAPSGRDRLEDVFQHQDPKQGVDLGRHWLSLQGHRSVQGPDQGQDVNFGGSRTQLGKNYGLIQEQKSGQNINLGEHRPLFLPAYNAVQDQEHTNFNDYLPGVFGGMTEFADRKRNSRRAYRTSQNRKPDVFWDEIPQNRYPNQGIIYHRHPHAIDVRQDHQNQNTNFVEYVPASRRGYGINHGRVEDRKENSRRYIPKSMRSYDIIQDQTAGHNTHLNTNIPGSFGGIPPLQNQGSKLPVRRSFHVTQGQGQNKNVEFEMFHPLSNRGYDILQEQNTRQNLKFDGPYPNNTEEYSPLQNYKNEDYSSGQQLFGIKQNHNQDQNVDFERFRPLSRRDYAIQNQQDGKNVNFNGYHPGAFGGIVQLQNQGDRQLGRQSFYATQGQEKNQNVSYGGSPEFSRRQYGIKPNQLASHNINFGDYSTSEFKDASDNSWQEDKNQYHTTGIEKHPPPNMFVPDQPQKPINESSGQLFDIVQNKNLYEGVNIGGYYPSNIGSASKPIQDQDGVVNFDTIPPVFVPTVMVPNKSEKRITNSAGYFLDIAQNQKHNQGIDIGKNTARVENSIKPDQGQYQVIGNGKHPPGEESVSVYPPNRITGTTGTLFDIIQNQRVNIGGNYPSPIDSTTKPVRRRYEVANIDTITPIFEPIHLASKYPEESIADFAGYFLDVTQNQKQNKNISIGEYIPKNNERAIKQDQGQYQEISIGKHPALGEYMIPVSHQYENQTTGSSEQLFNIMQNQNKNRGVNVSGFYRNETGSAIMPVQYQDKVVITDTIPPVFESVVMVPNQSAKNITDSPGYLPGITQFQKQNKIINIGEYIAKIGNAINRNQAQYQMNNTGKYPALREPMIAVPYQSENQITDSAEQVFNIMQNQNKNQGFNNSGYYQDQVVGTTKPVQDEYELLDTGRQR